MNDKKALALSPTDITGANLLTVKLGRFSSNQILAVH